MIHEFRQLIKEYQKAKKANLKCVLATVVALDGSSYRKPGVRMLLIENDTMIGAVSGGCVEKDILRQAQSVFESSIPKMMTYDGRFRLGCEGILYVLIEPFHPSDKCLLYFHNSLKNREAFYIHSYFHKSQGPSEIIGSVIEFKTGSFKISTFDPNDDHPLIFSQELPPPFKLMIFGAEHDAVELCKLASFNGWDVTIIAGPLEMKSIEHFPGATAFYTALTNHLEIHLIDEHTAVVIMSHNFSNDLKYLIELKNSKPAYLGLLGPSSRREKLLLQFIDFCPEVCPSFMEALHAPVGLNIGAETPQEIAISIAAEILSVTRNQQPILLKEKKTSIHAKNILN